MKNQKIQILAFDTEGNPPGDFEYRLKKLLSNFSYSYSPYSRKSKFKNIFSLYKQAKQLKPKLIVMEGTGLAGGLALLVIKLFLGIPYVFCSGDAVGPYLKRKYPFLGPIPLFYEKVLYRFCSGFMGWTPYYCGRALTYGARRTITIAGWLKTPIEKGDATDRAKQIRQELGISSEKIVVGILGTMNWNSHINYCYGLELVIAMKDLKRSDIVALIVGGGSGLEKLKTYAGDKLNKTIFFPGRVARDEVPNYLCAMDIGSLPQSTDQAGAFRYTTKLSEYLACGLPIITGQIPLAYDFGSAWIWRIPGDSPWSSDYIKSLAHTLESLEKKSLELKKSLVPSNLDIFNSDDQIHRATEFLNDCLQASSK